MRYIHCLAGMLIFILLCSPQSFAQTTQPSTISLEPYFRRIPFDAPAKVGQTIRVIAYSPILQICALEFQKNDNHVRVNVGYWFADGRIDGAATFRMKLLDQNGHILAEQTIDELRNRNLPIEMVGRGVKIGGPDKPNRQGQVSFRFFNIAATDIASFSLDVTEAVSTTTQPTN